MPDDLPTASPTETSDGRGITQPVISQLPEVAGTFDTNDKRVAARTDVPEASDAPEHNEHVTVGEKGKDRQTEGEKDNEKDDGSGEGQNVEGNGDNGDNDDNDDEVGSNIPDGQPIPKRRYRSKADREAAKGRKAGNQGKFHGEPLEFLTSLVDAYVSLDRVSRGKNTRMKKFWYSCYAEFWLQFDWKMFATGAPGENKEKVIGDVNAVSIAFPWERVRETHP